MAQVMLTLGSFQFSISTAAYNELTQKWEWRWQEQSRVGRNDILQSTGKAANGISLAGQIATTIYSVGTKQLETLAALGDKQAPQLLTSGEGAVLGYWVMTALNAVNSKFVPGGDPKRQSFTMELKFYGDDLQNP